MCDRIFVLEQKWLKPGQKIDLWQLTDHHYAISHHYTYEDAKKALYKGDGTLVWWNIGILYRG